MSTPQTVEERYRRQVESFIDRRGAEEAPALRAKREAALERFVETGFPTRKQEEWRYTGIDGLLEADFRPLEVPTPAPSAERLAGYSLGVELAGQVVLVDGIFRPALSALPEGGIEVQGLRAAIATGDHEVLASLGVLSGAGRHAFEALNLATLLDGVVIRLRDRVAEARPLELLHLSTAAAAGHGLAIRHLVLMGEEAQGALLERFVSLGEGSCFTNQVMEIFLGAGASLVHERAQIENRERYHLAEIHVRPGAKSAYRGRHAALGGAWSRTGFHLEFAEPEASCEIDALYLAGEGQLTDYHLEIDHAVPACTSRETFKGILSGRGRAVFDGRVVVRPGAQKSDAHLGNANLMLSRQAEVDTKPQLEIYADDVQCSHGASVGQLDDEALFYLRSRGLDAAEARRMLSLAFAGEILQRFDTAALRERLTAQVAQRLDDGEGDEVSP